MIRVLFFAIVIMTGVIAVIITAMIIPSSSSFGFEAGCANLSTLTRKSAYKP